MIPAKYNMVCPQGSTFQQRLTYIINDVAVNLTGYEARMQVRERHASATPVGTFDTTNGGITIIGSEGVLDILMSAGFTEDLIPKEYVYDIEIVSPSSVVTRIIEGKFIVTPEVTRT